MALLHLDCFWKGKYIEVVKIDDELVELLSCVLKENKVSVREKDLSRMQGDRNFRNKVLHEGYSPENDEVKETEKDTEFLLGFLEDCDGNITQK